MKVHTYMSRFNEAAPVLSLALVFVFTAWLRHSPTHVSSFGAEQEAVAQAVETAPYRIGSWVGVDSTVPEAAVRLLKPNAMLSRRYNNLETHVTIDLVVVIIRRCVIRTPVGYHASEMQPAERMGKPSP